jgi:hypothetical protein
MRRLEDDADGLAAEVLRSARRDGPSDAARRRAALALGLATATATGAGVAEAAMGEGVTGVGATTAGVAPTALAVSSTTIAGATSATGATVVTLTSVGAAAASSGGWVVGLLFAAVVSSLAGAAWLVAGAAEAPEPPASQRLPDHAPPEVREAAASGRGAVSPQRDVTPAPVPAPGSAPAPSVEPASRGSTRRAPSAPPRPPAVTVREPAPASLGLADEILRLDRAKTALAAGEPGAALELLDTYERDAPVGALRPEAHALRIDAVLATGDRAAAAGLARDFVARFPEHHLRLRYAALASEP